MNRLPRRTCRTPLVSARVRRNEMTERFDKEWDELRRHATIEKDLEKLLRLTAEMNKGRRLLESPSHVTT